MKNRFIKSLSSTFKRTAKLIKSLKNWEFKTRSEENFSTSSQNGDPGGPYPALEMFLMAIKVLKATQARLRSCISVHGQSSPAHAGCFISWPSSCPILWGAAQLTWGVWPTRRSAPKASLINTNQERFQQNSSGAISFSNGTWTTVLPSLALLVPDPLVPFLLHPRAQQGLLAERSNQSATGCSKCWGKEREVSKFYHWSSFIVQKIIQDSLGQRKNTRGSKSL